MTITCDSIGQSSSKIENACNSFSVVFQCLEPNTRVEEAQLKNRQFSPKSASWNLRSNGLTLGAWGKYCLNIEQKEPNLKKTAIYWMCKQFPKKCRINKTLQVLDIPHLAWQSETQLWILCKSWKIKKVSWPNQYFIPVANLFNQNGYEGSRNITHSNVECPDEGGSWVFAAQFPLNRYDH